MPNRLAAEKSVYLLQHRDNPVDWYPWGPEALERARRERKPLLVSIGYSSCHWCHVMERESFEDPQIAELMNENFVCIKVDREERPDVDQIYMEAVVRLTGSGGWPLNVFCTADGRPFTGGTYFPPERAYGRPSWKDVLQSVARVYREKPEEVEEQSRRVLEALSWRPEARAGRAPGCEELREFTIQLMRRADTAHGGFGTSPKFPTPTNLEAVLLAHSLKIAAPGALEHALFTLHRMARGGIYDQLGGGFHRYSVDEGWRVPHFEKMLYDQGLLLRVYAEAYRQAHDPDLVWPVAETIGFLEREMRAPDGGYYASRDADSEGEEGRHYVWTVDEIREVLGAEEGDRFCTAYGVDRSGNLERTGRSVLSHALAGERTRFADSRARLLRARAARAAPEIDRKRICAWIGYTISGLAAASSAFDRPEWLEAARRAADFVLERLVDAGGRLLRVAYAEEARIPAFLDDHASMLAALLDLHRAGGTDRPIEAALVIAEAIRDRFYDADAKDLFLVPPDGTDLILRPSSDLDGATPSAAGLATLGLVRIGTLTGRRDLVEVAERVLTGWSAAAKSVPLQFPTLLRGAALLEKGPGVAIVVGDPAEGKTAALAARAREMLSIDEAVVVVKPGKVPAWLDPSWIAGREPRPGVPTAYLCRGTACSLPATEPSDLQLP